MNALDFLVEASKGVGRIVSSGDLNEYQMAEARQSGKWFVDEETGLGWALLPWELVTDQDLKREKARTKRVVVATEDGSLDQAIYVDGVLTDFESTIYAHDIESEVGNSPCFIETTETDALTGDWPKNLADLPSRQDD